VLVNDNDVTLPNGGTVLSGAALLVLCGARSESINVGSVDLLLDEEGVYHFKHLIDRGRFVTADVRAALEDAGVILFLKDACAKKRGVNTSSSSLEVSAASSLANEEFNVHDMRVPTNLSKDAPQFDKGKLT
jgi:NAD-specific glutamate dehydrogenase